MGGALSAVGARKRKPGHTLWSLASLLAVGLALLPFDPGSHLTQLHMAGWAVPDRLYHLIKPAILWAGLGTVAGLAGAARHARKLGGAVVFGLLLVTPFVTGGLTWADVVEALAVLPGLAAGLWLGERSRMTVVPGELVPAANPSLPDEAGEVDLAPAHPVDRDEHMDQKKSIGPATHSARRVNAGEIIAGLALVLAVALSLVEFPLGRAVLAVGLAVYGITVWRWPGLMLIAIAAALPVLDFAPWTGRFFWDEFDLLMLVTLGVALWQGRLKASAWTVPKLGALLTLFMMVWVVSLLVGLLPLQPLDANAFSTYWSHYNSLRLAKGLLWALVVYALFHSEGDRLKAFDRLSTGMALGVLGASLWALWEEALFAGSATTADYRVTASFSSMHTGGGHIEAYLVIALPFVWGLFFRITNPFFRAALAITFLLGAYALVFTVARGGAIAFVVALLVLIWGTWRAKRKQSRHRLGMVAPLALGTLTLFLIILGVSGVFWKQRLEQTGTDASIRLHHWADVLGMRDNGVVTSLFGEGLGTFPAVSLANQSPDMAGSYRYLSEGGNTYLALNSAGTLYMAQRVKPSPGQLLKLELSVRAPSSKAGLEVSLCEKSLFNSRQCKWLKVDFKSGEADWQNHTQTFNSGEVGAGNLLSRRPVQLSLYNPVAGTVVDVDNVRLLDASGHDLLQNGDFSRGGDFWFFKAGNHLVWHAKNLWVHLLFEQGWVGLMLFTSMLVLALVRLMRAARRGEPEATVLLACTTAWVVVGGVDSLLDAPRIALLVYATLFIGAAWGAEPHTRVKHRRHRHHHRLAAEVENQAAASA
jgi:O-Antigen ligase